MKSAYQDQFQEAFKLLDQEHLLEFCENDVEKMNMIIEGIQLLKTKLDSLRQAAHEFADKFGYRRW